MLLDKELKMNLQDFYFYSYNKLKLILKDMK